MKFISLFIFAVFAFVCAYGAPVEEMNGIARMSQTSIEDLRDRLAAVGGCNANVCFAIDGSGSLNATEFIAEKNFVLDVVSVIAVDYAVELSAVQYGTASSPISSLTADVEDFILKVNREQQLEAGNTFLVAGVNYCFSQLARRSGEALKMVILGDGFSTLGDDPVPRTDLFRRALNGKVCAVGAGVQNDEVLLGLAGGNPDQVFKVGNFLDVLDLQRILEGLVEGICNVKLMDK